MSFSQMMNVTASALEAQRIRMHTHTSNMANAENITGNPETVYQPRYAVFQAQALNPQNEDIQGVHVLNIQKVEKNPQALYWPEHPLADDQGYVYKPNVDVLTEMVDLMAASRSYQESLEVFSTTKNLLMRTLQMGGS